MRKRQGTKVAPATLLPTGLLRTNTERKPFVMVCICAIAEKPRLFFQLLDYDEKEKINADEKECIFSVKPLVRRNFTQS